jgi:hypothetical protein
VEVNSKDLLQTGWDEMGSVPNRLSAESHTEEFRAACEEVWQQNRLVVERGVVAKIATWYWNSCLFEGCKSVTTKLALGRSSVVAKIATCSKDVKCAYKNSSLLEIVWRQNWLLDRGM